MKGKGFLELAKAMANYLNKDYNEEGPFRMSADEEAATFYTDSSDTVLVLIFQGGMKEATLKRTAMSNRLIVNLTNLLEFCGFDIKEGW